MSARRYKIRMDREWFHIPRQGHLLGCCDCGLVHLIKARLRNWKIEIQATRMPRHTAGMRSRTTMIEFKRGWNRAVKAAATIAQEREDIAERILKLER